MKDGQITATESIERQAEFERRLVERFASIFHTEFLTRLQLKARFPAYAHPDFMDGDGIVSYPGKGDD